LLLLRSCSWQLLVQAASAFLHLALQVSSNATQLSKSLLLGLRAGRFMHGQRFYITQQTPGSCFGAPVRSQQQSWCASGYSCSFAYSYLLLTRIVLDACAGVAVVSAGSNTAWFPDAAAAAPAAATAASEGTPATSLIALATSAPDASSVTVQLVDTASGSIVETAHVAVPVAAHPTSGPAPHVVAAWLDAGKRNGAAAGSSALQGCRLLLLWSDDQITLVSAGKVAWTREEALGAGTSNLFIDLPAARRAAATAADSAGTSPPASAASAGLLGLLRDNEKLKRWVRLQVLSVLVQFKLSSQQEQEEFLQLRQALRWVAAAAFLALRVCTVCTIVEGWHCL
jgi:hypothetical protein